MRVSDVLLGLACILCVIFAAPIWLQQKVVACQQLVNNRWWGCLYLSVIGLIVVSGMLKCYGL
ncbi:MAG: hypothetical protein CR972_02440 [Candidatus Moraniibacteriota bacterium]|nr:MAG: hypothetical protein CR972_02440 [Candidatus Moranbacteria bacterium]